jgi:flap endonuclease-1
LEGLQLSHDEFVDLCILLGCDYCDSIKGVGPKTALKLIREYKNIETILQNINTEKYKVPDNWLPPSNKRLKTDDDYTTDDDEHDDEKQDEDSKKKDDDEEEFEPVYVQARRLFNEHEVMKSPTLKWTECQPEALTKFLVDDMGFNPERVKNSIEKLQKAFKATSKPQSRMDSFFQVKTAPKKLASPKKSVPTEAKKKSGGFFGKCKR